MSPHWKSVHSSSSWKDCSRRKAEREVAKARAEVDSKVSWLWSSTVLSALALLRSLERRKRPERHFAMADHFGQLHRPCPLPPPFHPQRSSKRLTTRAARAALSYRRVSPKLSRACECRSWPASCAVWPLLLLQLLWRTPSSLDFLCSF